MCHNKQKLQGHLHVEHAMFGNDVYHIVIASAAVQSSRRAVQITNLKLLQRHAEHAMLAYAA